jgi:hypothetical protein
LQIETLRLAHEFSDQKTLKYFLGGYINKGKSKKKSYNGVDEIDVGALPLDVLSDIRKAAKRIDADKLLQEIGKHMSD